MGGPLHRAALETLDRFRKKGLYEGIQPGRMLGTAFYPDIRLRFKVHGNAGADLNVKVRNGLWVKRPPQTSELRLGKWSTDGQRD